MRRTLLVALLLACTSPGDPEPPAKPDAAPVEAKAEVPDGVASEPAKDAEITVVGVIHQDGTRTCDAKGNDSWVDLHYVVGFTPLVLDEALTKHTATMHRKPAVVSGSIQAREAKAAPPNLGECPQWQMRSDMVITAEGLRVPRGPRAAEGVAATRVVPFEGLKVARAGDTLKLAFMNTLDVPLDAKAAITVHYEGCFGKPGSDATSSVRETAMKPGESWTVDAPAFMKDPTGGEGRQLYRADSIEVRASGEKVVFEFDAGLHELGGEGVTCPRD